jgi:hypothetical protein
MDEREVLLAWRALFREESTPETFAKAEEFLDGLSGESPLHIRLANELEELKRGPATRGKKRSASRG